MKGTFKFSPRISENYCDDKESIRRRLNESDRVISELLRDGRELIQDIRVANDKREVERRVKEAEIREGSFVPNQAMFNLHSNLSCQQNFWRNCKLNRQRRLPGLNQFRKNGLN